MSIILCGFQGIGKTYFGKIASCTLRVPFFDVDEEMLKNNNEVCVRSLSLRLGEPEFRRQEVAVVLQLMEKKNCLIALGGGSLTNEVSQKAIQESVMRGGVLLYLYQDQVILQKKLLERSLPTYLKDPFDSFRKLFVERHAVFSRLACEVIVVDQHTNDEVIERICAYGK